MIQVCRTQEELNNIRQTHGKVGFVPTMGNLHQGHISLLSQALNDFDVVYFSIFVNPKQFGPNEDFDKYPRTLQNDLDLIEEEVKKYQNKQVVIFAPQTPDEVYRGFNKTIKVAGITEILEGSIRPGHFDGVTTVVYRLFDLVKPTKAYFGLKDYQQWAVIKEMVRQEKLAIDIMGMPIKRSAEGLALSSRNQYLSDKQKQDALMIINTLNEIKKIIDGKKANLALAQDFITKKLEDKNWDYLTMRDYLSLSEDLKSSKQITILAVYRMGATRLLDNIQVEIQ
jgi:pantoate--beta-alanine ligase